MTIDAFAIASLEFEPAVIKEEEVTPAEAVIEELELEEPTLEAAKAEKQKIWNDPIRPYLYEIGRVPLLTASDEKTILLGST